MSRWFNIQLGGEAGGGGIATNLLTKLTFPVWHCSAMPETLWQIGLSQQEQLLHANFVGLGVVVVWGRVVDKNDFRISIL